MARAVEDSERRLTEHIDEAVLALAEALLRRRPPRGRTDLARVAPPAAPPTAADTGPVLEIDEDDDLLDADDEVPESIRGAGRPPADPLDTSVQLAPADAPAPAVDDDDEADDDEADDDKVADDEEEPGEHESPTAPAAASRPSWQTPPGAPPASAPGMGSGSGPASAAVASERDRKRKWWRPGD